MCDEIKRGKKEDRKGKRNKGVISLLLEPHTEPQAIAFQETCTLISWFTCHAKCILHGGSSDFCIADITLHETRKRCSYNGHYVLA